MAAVCCDPVVNLNHRFTPRLSLLPKSPLPIGSQLLLNSELYLIPDRQAKPSLGAAVVDRNFDPTVATDEGDQIRSAFSRCRELYDEFREQGFGEGRFNLLSMGMSNDFEVAIAEGSNLVRVGSAIFGERADGHEPDDQADGEQSSAAEPDVRPQAEQAH